MIIKVIKWAVDYCNELTRNFNYIFSFGITTNGTLLTQDIADVLKQHTKEVHDSLRPYTAGEGSYATLEERSSLLRNNSKVSVRGSLTQRTFQLCDMPSLLDAYKQLGAKSVFLTPVDVSKVKGAEGLAVRRKELSKYLLFCEQITRNSLGEMQAGRDPDFFFRPLCKALKLMKIRRTPQKMTGCGVSAAMVTVRADGYIYPCHRFVGMPAFAIGTIDKGVDENKNSEMLRRAERSQEKCNVCWARCFCGGICIYSCADREGNFCPPPKDDCSYAKEAIEIAIALLAEYPEINYQKIFDYAKEYR